MASEKLTNTLRDDIRNKVLKHRFGEEANRLVSARAALARRVYDDAISPADRRKLNDLPDGWVPTDDDIAFSAGTDYVRLPFSGSAYGDLHRMSDKVDAVRLRMPAKMKGVCAKTYPATHEIAKAWSELHNAEQDFYQRLSDAKNMTDATLRRISTTRRLVEAWPEIEPFVPKADKPLSLPAVPTASLNAVLGLPVESEAA